MKFKLKEKEVDASWREKFVFFKKTQDNFLVILDTVWTKYDLTHNKQIYRANK
jgi:hypothetical protein